MSTDPSPTSVDLADYVRVIRRQLWLIVLITLLVAGAAAAYTVTRATTYVASAQVALPAATTEASREQRLADVETEVAVMRSELVAARAAEELGVDNARQLRRRLSVDPPTEARVMTVRFRADDAEEARLGAQAFAEAYIAHNRERVQSQIDEQSSTIEQQIDAAEQQLADAQARRADADPGSPEERSAENAIVRLNNDLAQLNNQLAEVQTQAVDGGQVITPATTPGSATSRSIVRNTALGLLVGLALGLAAAFIRNRFDQEVGGAVDIAQVLGVPILGTIPDRRNQGARLVMTDAPESAAADAFRRLRSSFLVAAEDIDAGVVGVSSAVAGEGKSTVVANLAAALGQAGSVGDADLRRPAPAGDRRDLRPRRRLRAAPGAPGREHHRGGVPAGGRARQAAGAHQRRPAPQPGRPAAVVEDAAGHRRGPQAVRDRAGGHAAGPGRGRRHRARPDARHHGDGRLGHRDHRGRVQRGPHPAAPGPGPGARRGHQPRHGPHRPLRRVLPGPRHHLQLITRKSSPTR